MNYDQCLLVIEQFQAQHPEILMGNHVHGLQVVLHGTEHVLELVVTKKIPASQLLPDEVMPASFSYSFEGDNGTIKTAVVVRDIPSPSVDQGDRASLNAVGSPFGTAGWNVFLITQGVWVCVSNHHVLVDPHNPQHGINIFLDGLHRAQLHAFTLTETWDWALARYNNPADANQQFRMCADGSRYPDARTLANDITMGGEYRKVGARAPICRTGTLRGVGNRRVGPYPDGITRYFLAS